MPIGMLHVTLAATVKQPALTNFRSVYISWMVRSVLADKSTYTGHQG